MNYRRIMLIAMQYVYGILGISASILTYQEWGWDFSITSFQTILSIVLLSMCTLAIIAIHQTIKSDKKADEL